MTGRRLWWLAALIGALLLRGGRLRRRRRRGRRRRRRPPATTSGEECDTTDKVTLQLKWVTQAQFAGYYAAQEEGFYEDECLDVTIRPGGPDIVPEQVVLGGQAEFGIDWLDNLLATRDQGEEIVNIAQVFARSGMTEVSFKDSGIDSIDDLKGKKVGVWLGGNEHKLFAALTKNGIDPQKDVEIVAQPFDMNLLLNRRGRRRRGDDLQRARAGARAEEPGHGQALHARRAERDQDVRRRHGRARGRDLRHRPTGSPTRRTRTSRRGS